MTGGPLGAPWMLAVLRLWGGDPANPDRVDIINNDHLF